ncbi:MULTISPECIES: flagellar basal body L-ring protein FlgH [Photobacterium]|uniref:Flagellar L-ring protein n=1 Tax=Photobacterium halotolerans TaxID=265726 RepID=A0A0F5VI74_9GAMM|nr:MULTISPECIES: flagellar basal body L-ring protein FlgH [Photobacterium]KKD01175.1 flagellar L-ring protein FlgH [Photobacterium halotolerans]UIP28697.1 flagellar basal body L-ring protein FlgH [Photobacterium sp. TLY01]
MKNWLLTAVILTLTGCVQMPEQQDELTQATTNVDAVEGNQESSGGDLIDLVRRRDDPQAGDPAWSSIRPQDKPAHYATATGSLFSQALAQDMYDDTRPRGIGDIVTVMLAEKNKANKSASTDLDKSTDLTMDPLTLGGKPLTIGDRDISYDVNNSNTFSGSTSADQSNSIQGSISVEVVDVLANGNLLVRGEKWLTLNSGDEYIRLSGTIRPDDITQENTIESTRIANARIQYSGTGDRQDVQEQGWLARFFNVSL